MRTLEKERRLSKDDEIHRAGSKETQDIVRKVG